MRYVIVLDFGYSQVTEEVSSITDLAWYVCWNYWSDAGTVILAQPLTYKKLLRDTDTLDGKLLKIDVGQSNTTGLEDGGSYHVLKRASEMIGEYCEVESAQVEVVAHKLHLPRILKQAKLFGLNATFGEGLPTKLYSTAAQWWCRNKYLWYLREIIGYIPLKLSGQI